MEVGTKLEVGTSWKLELSWKLKVNLDKTKSCFAKFKFNMSISEIQL